ncbi:MAG: cytochrome c [Gammaproteobacteria bacterium]|nr:cytochrome c [Gammaproteobacteria bacterium]MYI02949.1 cytochrome c [Gammaproteobacteria bacterium]
MVLFRFQADGIRFRLFRIGLARRSAAVALALFAACGDSNVPLDRIDPETGRWYTAELAAAGSAVFARHCAECHGDAAQGTADDWRARLPDGSFPPPPLNGSAHTWHHPISVLLQVIDMGGESLGGQMPGFGQLLRDDEKLAVIAWFQEFWSDEIYEQWLMMGGAN